MEIKNLTCVECPMGCRIEAGVENGVAVYVKGNSCPRGKLYAETEVVRPMRVLTTSVRCTDGTMLQELISDENGIRMPSFFGYILWSVCFLVPVFLLDAVIFFR